MTRLIDPTLVPIPDEDLLFLQDCVEPPYAALRVWDRRCSQETDRARLDDEPWYGCAPRRCVCRSCPAPDPLQVQRARERAARDRRIGR